MRDQVFPVPQPIVLGHEGAGIVVALPISVRHITWYAETTDDISPFSSHEHDAGLKPSYGRRDWALSFAADPAARNGALL